MGRKQRFRDHEGQGYADAEVHRRFYAKPISTGKDVDWIPKFPSYTTGYSVNTQ